MVKIDQTYVSYWSILTIRSEGGEETMKLVKELASLETFDGWGKLELNEQNKLTIETQALEKATETYEMSNLEIGEHLDKISQVLSPKP